MFRRAAALFLTAALITTGSHGAGTLKKELSIVLVHGAFVDGSGWKALYDSLEKDGYEVIVVQNSTATFDGDVATTERAIASAKYPVVLVGHSYAGSIITEAGNDPKVRSLVYVAAFAPDAGESTKTLIDQPVPGAAPVPLLPPQDGFLMVDPAKFPHAFAADVDTETTRFMAVSQVPWGLAAVEGKVKTAAWKNKPSHFLITTEDLMIPTPAQRSMANRIGAKVKEIKSSHAVMLSHPADVERFIIDASKASL
jgi:pimeloyl-ACP methyl ester carboxylesterase